MRRQTSRDSLLTLVVCAATALSPVAVVAEGGPGSDEFGPSKGFWEPSVAPAAGPIVHIINAKPDERRGAVKLARYNGVAIVAAGHSEGVVPLYEELCTEPCGVVVDTTDNPIFVFIRDGDSVSYPFRLQRDGEITLRLKPYRRRLAMGGAYLTCILILPVGIPMLIAGRSKVSIADGAPHEGQVFTKHARTKS
jgi:hypothetical protein